MRGAFWTLVVRGSLRSHLTMSALLLHPSPDVRQLFPLMERRRGRKLPLERCCALAPGVGGYRPLAAERLEDPVEEDQRADAGNVRSVGRDHVPPGEGVGIVDVAT